MEIFPYSYSSGRDLELVDLPAEPVDVKRQDSLYRDATMPAHHGHNGQVYYYTLLHLCRRRRRRRRIKYIS
jgi:KUP system potassium uptake protein